MSFLLLVSMIFIAWTALHMLAAEREQRVAELRMRQAIAAAVLAKQKAAAEEPVVVR